MRTSRVGVLAAAALLLSACTSTITGTPTAGQTEQLGPKGPVPAGLERYYGQALTWRDCRSLSHDDESKSAFGTRGVECALLSVPLDYAKPDGRTITVGVLRQRATGEKVGSLLLNPGGPGASGMSAAVFIAGKAKKSALVEKFDIIGFDPRGVGVSEPRIECLTDAEMDAKRVQPEPDTVAEVEAENKAYADGCAKLSGGAEVLANVGTREVIRDMDVLRSALGDEKLSYLGYSYGTRIGTAYAETFPGNVRAMILDGAVDPNEDPAQQTIGQVKGFEQALDAYFAQCSRCKVTSKSQLEALLKPLEDKPLAVGNRKLSLSDASTGIAAALYNDEYWVILTKALDELSAGKGDTFLLLADAYIGRDSKGGYSNLMAALNAIRCVDEPRITDRVTLESTSRQITEATKGTFMADTDPPLPALDTCAFWPVPNTSQPHQPKVDGIPTLLVISTTGDPATPYTAGVNLAKDLNARLITYKATQHTAFLDGSSCVDDAGIDYLVTLKPPAQDLTC
ncbi:alpha/beta hydrolase [Actinokineospora diospyrosa]|uniref:Alpha/beta hydrolase fold n=1 Tax=Actinokineospora diospyrosa TaxID=103728 RepID=A0ABT1ILD8_9PSEU|nr:alpha/beta hydrolase [Actinokineospora diospyrosa]MCP2273472.1 alpha/beta hydrolase fold [Actinokineospora diospyrosa]